MQLAGRIRLTFALVALGRDNAADVAEKLTKQFPDEGGAWAALAVAMVGEGDAVGSRNAWKRALSCEYIEDDARRIALNHVQPNG